MQFEVTVVVLLLTMLMILTYAFFPDNKIFRIINGRRIYIIKFNSNKRARAIKIHGVLRHTPALNSRLQKTGKVPKKQKSIDLHV